MKKTFLCSLIIFGTATWLAAGSDIMYKRFEQGYSFPTFEYPSELNLSARSFQLNDEWKWIGEFIGGDGFTLLVNGFNLIEHDQLKKEESYESYLDHKLSKEFSKVTKQHYPKTNAVLLIGRNSKGAKAYMTSLKRREWFGKYQTVTISIDPNNRIHSIWQDKILSTLEPLAVFEDRK